MTISGLSHDAGRLALSKEFGADVTVDVSKEDVIERVRQVTGGEMADVVLDISDGSTEPCCRRWSWSAGADGSCWPDRAESQSTALITDKIVAGELQVLGGFSSTTESLLTALEILKTHQHRLSKICSYSFDLGQADLAVRTLGREVDDGTEVLHVTIVVARQ